VPTVRYVTADDVISYHAAIYRSEGMSPAALIASAKLGSAVLRPESEAFGEEFFPTLAEKAAPLVQVIVVAHPFADGNKRAAAAAMFLFLEWHGVPVDIDQDLLYDFVIAVTTGELREVEDIAARRSELFAPHLD
jgi:death-on-curing protein